MLKSWSVPMMLVGLVTLCGCNKWDDDARTEGYLGGEKERSSRSMSKAFYKEVEHDGRLLVIGTKEMYNSVKAGDPMPYEKTVIGAGPNGETVKFQIDKKDATVLDRLEKTYYSKHPFYREVEAHGRIHVIGTIEMFKKVLAGDPMPYERTLIGEGPNGETVKIQIDKKDPSLVERLHEMYKMKNPFYREVERHGRIHVIGTKDMYAKVLDGDPMPYEKTVIGAGPNGETVKFEIDKKDADLCDRLQTMFAEKHPFYREVEAHGRLHVIGTQDMYAKVLSGDPMPYEKTFIGAGPGGKTVKIQIDKKDHDLLPRLIAEFNKRHKTNL